MRIKDVKGETLYAIGQIGQEFTVKELIGELAVIAFINQNSVRKLHHMEHLSKDMILQRGEYAFCSQTNHPLHRAYEQSVATMVNYIGAQYTIPSWVFLTMKDVLKGCDKGLSRGLQIKYKKLLKEMMLPMISRMRYQYSHNIQDDVKLFEKGHYGNNQATVYGYELCDTGLPTDFEYSTELYHKTEMESSYIPLERFKKYAPGNEWRKVNTSEKFVSFVKDVILETTNHLIQTDRKNRAQWAKVSEKMSLDVSHQSFGDKMIHLFFGKSSSQKKEFRKNPVTLKAAPWKLKWGGDPEEVLKTYYGFMQSPNKLNEYKGSPREVLAHHINWVRNRPDEFKDDFDDPAKMFLVTSPCHAFIMTPSEPSFREAYTSKLSAAEYIKRHVEAPGLSIANQPITFEIRKTLLDSIASNNWSQRKRERHDFERQELTVTSKLKFDKLVRQTKKLSACSAENFLRKVWIILVDARAAEPKIGKRNSTWDQKAKRILANKFKSIDRTDPQWKRQILDFARNRQDKNRLTYLSIRKLRNSMQQLPKNCSITEFRNRMVKTCYQLHCQELFVKRDAQWMEPFCSFLDNKIFKLLSGDSQKTLIDSGVITHDPNWKDEMYDIKTIWMINPGSGKLEFCDYLPDTESVTFRGQSAWFPKGESGAAWQLPKLYHAWKAGPLFNVPKLMDI